MAAIRKRLRKIGQELDSTERIGIVLAITAVAVAVIGFLNQHAGLNLGTLMSQLIADFYANVSAEMGGIVITVLILDRLAQRREAKREEQRRKEALIAQLGSRVRDVPVGAAEELRRYGWLEDGSLRNARLHGANMEGIDLWKADLGGANLFSANLRGANLSWSDLEGAGLRGADLRGVDFYSANLRNADLHDAVFDENTTLPDGGTWTPRIDMEQFTNPEHPDFWRSDVHDSPAYQGRDGGED